MDDEVLPQIIVLGIDGLEYNLVREWLLKNIMQKTYGKLDLSDFKVVVTPPIWGSMLTGKIDDEVMKIWVKRAELMGRGININVKQKWWTKIGKNFPTSVNLWLWEHILAKLIGGEPFERTASYVLEKNEPNIFQFFNKPWTNGIPSYGRNACPPDQKKLIENALEGDKTPYRKDIIKHYQNDKLQLFSTLDKHEFDFIFWYTPLLDNIGHMDMSRPLTLMMKHYLEINGLVGEVKAKCPRSIIYIISDHGMENMDPKKGLWGDHSDHGFFSSNTGEIIDKPFQLYNLISKHKSG